MFSKNRSATMLSRKLAYVFLCWIAVPPAWAADAQYDNVAANQHLQSWLLLGPVPAQEAGATPGIADARKMGLEHDLLASAGGEAQVEPQAGQSVAVRGGELKWQLHDSDRDAVDLNKVFGPRDFVVAYAAATIESPEDQSRIAGLGSDDAVRVWVNGELVHDNAAARALMVDNDVFPIKLKKGANRIVIKVANDQGEWGFAFRFLSPELVAKQVFRAASAGDAETIERLASLGIDLSAKSPAGITAAQIAKMRGYEHVVEFLTSKGVPSPESFDASAFVTAILADAAADNAPGVAVLVARDGKVLLSRGFGKADLSHGIEITPTTKFRIGSITKQFTAAAILKLQEDGKLSVDDKLTKFIPDYPRGDEVTIHHLLTHTSGIKSFTSKPDFLTTATAPATLNQMIDSFKQDPFDFDPGSNFSYNNSGYLLLGFIIEKVSGKSYGDYLRDTFFKPLEMHDTGVHSSTAIIEHEATGYSYETGKATKALNWDMSRAGGAGALYSTVEDLLRWNEGIFAGKVLSEESLKAAFTPVKLTSGEDPMMSYGYGWMTGERRGLKTIFHGGGLHGWMSLLTRFVDQNVTVVVLHNASPPVTGLAPGEVSELAADAFLWQEMKPQPRYQEDSTVDPATFAAFVGRYDYLGAVMEVALEGKQLTAQLTGQPRWPIFPLGENRFFWKIVDAQIEFLKGDNDRVTSARHTQGGQSFVVKRLADEKVVSVDAETLDRYVGKYEYAGIGVLTVRRDGARLLAQMTGQPEFELFAKADDTFFWKVVSAEISFITGENGNIEKAIHRQAGATIEAKRVEY
jgi:CubicO group peptidase (beta-lactamase class C family)